MTLHTSPAGESSPAPVRLRIWRIDEGQVCQILFLADKLLGLHVHFVKRRSEYCDPRGCLYPCAKLRKVWKTYLPACYWDSPEQRWVPVVQEVTSSLELDLRGRLKRGQVWELTCPQKIGEKNPPISGRQLTTWPAADVPPAFDVRPPLCHLFGVDLVQLNVPNPLPPRPYVEPFSGPAPVDPAAQESAEPVRGAAWSDVREQLKAKGFRVNGNGQK